MIDFFCFGNGIRDRITVGYDPGLWYRTESTFIMQPSCTLRNDLVRSPNEWDELNVS